MQENNYQNSTENSGGSTIPGSVLPPSSSGATGMPGAPMASGTPVTPGGMSGAGIPPAGTPAPHHSKGKFLLGVIILIVLIAGGSFAYVKGVIFSHAPYSQETLLQDVIEGAEVVDTATSEFSFKFFSEPRAEGAKPFVVPAGNYASDSIFYEIVSMQRELSGLPGSFSMSMLFGGTTKKTDDGVDAKVNGAVEFDFGDMTLDAEAEYRKVGDLHYVIVNKFPEFFGDFSEVKNKWIKITTDDLAQYLGDDFNMADLADADKVKEQQEKFLEGAHAFIEIADKHQLLRATGEPVKDQVKGKVAYRYDLSINKAALPAFYKDLVATFDEKYGKGKVFVYDESLIKDMAKPEFNTTFDYFSQNTELTLWADGNGVPVKFEYSLRIVPDDSVKSLRNKQVKMVVSLTLSDINKSVKIEAPKETIPLEDAIIGVTGMTKEEYLFEKQRLAVGQVATALSTYRSYAGTYPAKLSDLNVSRNDLARKYKNGAGVSSLYLYEQSILKIAPKDVHTGKPFPYTSTGSSYEFKYEVRLPKYVPGSSIRQYAAAHAGSGYRYYLMMVDGTNTVTAETPSVEARKASAVDSDGDRLTDLLEEFIGSNKLKADTDGDGINDGAEVDRYTDPLSKGGTLGEGY